MSKITPCLWFKDEAEEAANFYVSLLPDSRITSIQRNPIDAPGGKAGTVLVVEFILHGQPFQALNGGVAMEYTYAVSFAIECEDQAEVDRLWEDLSAGGVKESCGWVKDRYGLSWQIVPKVLPQLLGGPDQEKAKRVMKAMLEMEKIDIAALENA